MQNYGKDYDVQPQGTDGSNLFPYGNSLCTKTERGMAEVTKQFGLIGLGQEGPMCPVLVEFAYDAALSPRCLLLY